jgi:hypothetical protein
MYDIYRLCWTARADAESALAAIRPYRSDASIASLDAWGAPDTPLEQTGWGVVCADGEQTYALAPKNMRGHWTGAPSARPAPAEYAWLCL